MVTCWCRTFNVARSTASFRSSPETLLDYMLFERLSPAPMERVAYNDLLAYLTANGAWTGSDAQTNTKSAGLVRLIVGSAEYQFI